MFQAKELVEFKGTINGTEINDKELFWSIRQILQEIESIFSNDNQFNSEIYFSDDFIEDLYIELESIYLKYEDETYESITTELLENLYFENEDLSDLKFNFYDMNRWFEYINKNLATNVYDFKTPNC